jgi:hypothetical protein
MHRRRRHVLEMGFLETPVPGAPQPKAAHALGQRPFDSGPPLIARLPLLAGIPGPCRFQRLVSGRGRQPHAPAVLPRSGADRPYGTRLTVVPGERHDDGAAARPGAMLPPSGRPLALRTADPLLGPIHFELVDRLRPVFLRLPARARLGRAT